MATLNEPTPLQIAATDGNTALFARAHVYSADGVLTATVSLPHLAEGLYGATWTPAIEGYFTSICTFYTDAGFTTPAAYDKAADVIEVNSNKTNLLRLLGLMKENAVLDQEVYDTAGHVTQARLRCYDSAVNATNATSFGLVFSYQYNATYDADGKLLNFTTLRTT